MATTVIAVVLLLAGLSGMGIAVAWIIRKGNNNRLTRLFGVCQVSYNRKRRYKFFCTVLVYVFG